MSIKHKHRLYKAFIKSPSALRESHYRNFRNKLTQLIKRAKRIYYDGQFERTKNELKSTWKFINEIINKRKSKPAMTSIFKADGKSITDPVIIAVKFCQYFSSIGSTLVKKIHSVISSFTSFSPDNNNLPLPCCLQINSNFRISVDHLNPENPLAMIIYQCILSRNIMI